MTRAKRPSDFFLYDLESDPGRGGPVDVVAFTGGTTVDVDLLVEAMREHLELSPPPRRLLLLGPEPAKEAIEAAAENPALNDALPAFTRWTETPQVHPLLFGIDGGLQSPRGDLEGASEPDFTAKLLRHGLRRIFDQREGMLRAGLGSHYVNPSGKHTQGFIRTGNVLLHSAEVAFVAMGVLKWWPSELRRIFVDTASISSVAYALIAMRALFEQNLEPPTIDSFSSYDGVHDFEFLPDHALCLISATTSGGLEEELIENDYLQAERIVTLFYCGPKPRRSARILCDLTRRPDQPGEPPPLSFKRAEECDMCRRGSSTIRISGDQFLPANPKVRDVVLNAGDAPPWLGRFLEAVVGSRVLRCHGGNPGSGRAREVYVHLQEAVSEVGGRFEKALRRRLRTMVPASLSKIVYVDHPSSRALAEAVAEHFQSESGRQLDVDSILSANAVLSREVSLEGVTGSVMVIAGAMSSGRTVLGISQFLRNVSEVESIVYLIGVARLPSGEDLDRVDSSLTYGRYAKTHPLVIAATAFLPGEHGVEPSPWESERTLLADVLSLLEDEPWDDDEEVVLAVEQIEARRREIAAAAADGGGGLIDRLFLPRARDGEIGFEDGNRLALRDGFVFWRSLPKAAFKAGTQADVYVTMLAVLHRLRSAEPDGSALVQHEHNRTVLSPANFARFNDGVIQAALLRAARPGELDYSHEAILSAQMQGLVRRAIEHMGEDEGEAAVEFLLAFAGEQFKLTPDDTNGLLAFLEEADLPPLMRALCLLARSLKPPALAVAIGS
ncbi:MAG TPA: hypothetical protein VIT89_07610 [Solirubrobacterales bacterium]